MKREIKFRAWDGKKMFHEVTIYNDRFIDCACAHDDVFYQWHDPSEQVAIMQFTGLKDKNGKEIYEGDRVKRRVVIFENNEGFIDINCDVKWNGWCYALLVADKQMWGLDPITAKECEIIGNIHEHPHLVNKNQG